MFLLIMSKLWHSRGGFSRYCTNVNVFAFVIADADQKYDPAIVNVGILQFEIFNIDDHGRRFLIY